MPSMIYGSPKFFLFIIILFGKKHENFRTDKPNDAIKKKKSGKLARTCVPDKPRNPSKRHDNVDNKFYISI